MKWGITVIIVMTWFSGFAQSNIGLNLGVSQPIGDFGSRNVDNDDAGFAKTGSYANINFQTMLNPSIGFSVQIEGAYWDFSNRDFKGGSDQFYVTSRPWKTFGVFLGGFKQIPLNDVLKVNLGANLGLMFVENARININYKYSGDISQKSATVATLAARCFVDFEYPLKQNLLLVLNLSPTFMKPEFRNVKIQRTYYKDETITFSQSIIYGNFGIGIKYILGQKSE